MTGLSLLLAAAVQAAPATAPPTPPAPFERLFTDWGTASRQSLEAERTAMAQPPVPQTAAVPAGAALVLAPGSAALGERVGEIVALGDCAEGERMARAAGDFALLAAVRAYCEAPPEGR